MGTVVGIANTTRDRSKESFAEEKFRLAVEACPSGMVMTDSAGAQFSAAIAAASMDAQK